MEQKRKSKNRATHIWSVNFWQRYEATPSRKISLFNKFAGPNGQPHVKNKINKNSDLTPYSKSNSRGSPGGAVVESLPANAGDTGSSPGLGGSHMPWSNWAREPQLLSLSVWSLCSATREAATVRSLHTAMKSGPCSPQLEKALTQKRGPNTAKNK